LVDRFGTADSDRSNVLSRRRAREGRKQQYDRKKTRKKRAFASERRDDPVPYAVDPLLRAGRRVP